MKNRNLKIIMKHFLETMSEQNISAYAASTAFFFFLSMVPVMIMLFILIPYTPLTRMDIINVLNEVVPGGMESAVFAMMDSAYERSNGVLPLAILVTLWSAGSGTLALKRGLNSIYRIKEKWNYFLVRVFSSLYTLIMLVLVLVMMLIVVFEKQLLSLVVRFVPNIHLMLEFLLPFRYLVMWVVLLLVISLVYTFLPSGRQKFVVQIPGAAFVSLAWSLCSWGFSWYVTIADYSVYGSLSVVVILLLWIYMCMYLLLLGAYVNSFFESANRAFIRSRYDRRTKEKQEKN